MIDPRDFGLPGSSQVKNVSFERVDYGWVREKVEEDHDFIYRIYILRFFGLWVRYGNNGIFI